MWATTIVSQLGSFAQVVGSSWAMAALDPSSAMVALVQTAANLPVMLFAIPAGALADFADRRAVMLSAQLSMLVLSVGLSLCTEAGWLTPGALLAFTFLIGCGTAIHAPTWQASVGDLVPRAEIPSAVAANVVGNNVARSIGPAIGGWIVLMAGAGTAFAANALSYLGIVGVLWRWRPDGAARARRRFDQVLAEGFRFAFGRRAIRALFLRAGVFGVGAAAIWGLMTPVVLRLDGGPDLLGILLGAFGVGGMAGAAISVRLRHWLGSEGVARAGWTGVALATLLLGLVPWIPAAVAAHVVAGAGWVLTLSTFNVSIQLSVPRAFVGRTLSIYQTMVFGGVAIASGLWGAAADRFGLDAALVAAGLFLLVGVVAGAPLGLPPPEEH